MARQIGYIGNAVILIAGSVMMIGVAIGLSIIVVYVTAVVLLKRLKRGPHPALTAGS